MTYSAVVSFIDIFYSRLPFTLGFRAYLHVECGMVAGMHVTTEGLSTQPL